MALLLLATWLVSVKAASAWHPSYSSLVGNATMARSESSMVAGYDSRKNSIILLGGRQYPRQLARFSLKYNSFEDLGSDALDFDITMTTMGYTQVKDILWIIDSTGTRFVWFNTRTLELEKTDIAFPANVADSTGIRACLASWSNYIFVVGGPAFKKHVQIYDTKRGEWSTDLLELTIGLEDPGCVALNGEMFVMGGTTSSNTLSNYIYTFNLTVIETQNATQRAARLTDSLTKSQYRMRPVHDSSNVYMLGGASSSSGSSAISTVTVASQQSDSVIARGTTALALTNSAVVCTTKDIYIFGGQDEYSYSNQYQFIKLESTESAN